MLFRSLRHRTTVDKYAYRVVWSPDDNEFVATCVELPALSALYTGSVGDKSRSTVQVSIRTLRNSIISQMNFTESEKILIESAIFEEIKKFGLKIQE